MVKLLSCVFCDNPAPALAFVALWDTSVLACSISQEKIRNYHLGSVSFPGSLNLPIWSVWHPNPWWVSCHPVHHPVILLEKVPQGERVGLSVPPESCIPPYPPFPCGKQNRICSDMGAEKKGVGKRWGVSWEQKEAKGRSPDFGPWVMFWLCLQKSGVVLWELTVELWNDFAPLLEVIPSQETH